MTGSWKSRQPSSSALSSPSLPLSLSRSLSPSLPDHPVSRGLVGCCPLPGFQPPSTTPPSLLPQRPRGGSGRRALGRREAPLTRSKYLRSGVCPARRWAWRDKRRDWAGPGAHSAGRPAGPLGAGPHVESGVPGSARAPSTRTRPLLQPSRGHISLLWGPAPASWLQAVPVSSWGEHRWDRTASKAQTPPAGHAPAKGWPSTDPGGGGMPPPGDPRD